MQISTNITQKTQATDNGQKTWRGNCYFNKLPNELIYEILKKLAYPKNELRTISRKIDAAIRENVLHISIDENIENKEYEVLNANRCSNVAKITVHLKGGSHLWNFKNLEQYRQLKELFILGDFHKTNDTFPVPLKIENLQKLDCSYSIGHNFNTKKLYQLLKNCPNLTSVSLADVFFDEDLDSGTSDRLTNLQIRNASFKTEQFIHSFLNRLPNIETLDIFSAATISDDLFFNSLKNSKKIVQVKIVSPNQFLNVSIEKNSPQKIWLRDCKFTNSFLKKIEAFSLQKISDLRINDKFLKDDALSSFLSYAKKINSLDLSHTLIKGDALSSGLSNFNLVSDATFANTQITGANFTHFLKKARNLELLSVYKPPEVNLIESNDHLKKLKEIDFSECENIEESQLCQILKNSVNLEKLVLDDCCKITDTALLEIIARSSKLKHLSLSNCTKITDLSFENISQKLPQLEVIDVTYLTNISNFSFSKILESPLLTCLKFDHTDQVDLENLLPSFSKLTKLKSITINDCISSQTLINLVNANQNIEEIYLFPSEDLKIPAHVINKILEDAHAIGRKLEIANITS